MLRSRLALFVSFWVLAIAGMLSYAGPAPKDVSIPPVLLRLMSDGPILLAWLIAAFGIGSILLAANLPRDSSISLLRCVSSVALGLGCMSLLTLGLGLAGWMVRTTDRHGGWFSHRTAPAMIVLGMLLATAQLIRSKTRLAEMMQWVREPALWNWLWIVTAPFMAIALVAAMLPPGILWRIGDPSFYDVVEYHLQIPREWYELGRIVPLHHNVFSFFPLNVEMHYLLAMHLAGGPWEGMYLAQLMHLAFVVLFVLAVYAVARQVAAPLPAMTGALAAATVPWLTQLAPIAYDEGGFLLFSTLAVGWAWRAIAQDDNRFRHLAVAGVFAGLACGVKLTAVPEVLAVLSFATGALLLHRTRGNWIASIRGALLFAVVGLLAFSPWLVRNEIWAGNPVFPEAMHQLGPGEFSPAQVDRWERAHSARPDQRNLPARLHAAWREIVSSWQYGFVLIPLALGGIACGLASAPRRPQTSLFAGMLLALILIWMFATHLEGRFFVLAIPICGLLIAQIDHRCFSSCALTAVLIGGTFSGLHLHHRIASILRGEHDSPLSFPASEVIGMPDESFVMGNLLDGLPPGGEVVLIGDAKAFFYTIPTSQLHYRTVFDVRDDNRDILEAWNDGPIPKGARVVIDPAELERFHRTYAHIPEVLDWIERDAPRTPHGQPLPFVMNGSH